MTYNILEGNCCGVGFNSIKKKGKEKIPASIVPEDMLSFLKRLPDNSISILCSGIDYFIITHDYGYQVKEEISRVLDPNGALLNYSSEIVPSSLIKIHPKEIDFFHKTGLYKKDKDYFF